MIAVDLFQYNGLAVYAGSRIAVGISYQADIMRDPLQSNLCSTYLRAFAEPDRLRIVQCLRSGPKSVGQIARHLKTTMANTSHHLKFLRSAKLVDANKKGRFVIYGLARQFARAGAAGSLDSLDFGCCRIELPRDLDTTANQ